MKGLVEKLKVNSAGCLTFGRGQGYSLFPPQTLHIESLPEEKPNYSDPNYPFSEGHLKSMSQLRFYQYPVKGYVHLSGYQPWLIFIHLWLICNLGKFSRKNHAIQAAEILFWRGFRKLRYYR